MEAKHEHNSKPHNNHPHPHQPAVPQQEEEPDIALAVVSLVMPFVLPIPPISLVLALIASKQSAQRGYKNTIARISVIVNAIFSVLFVLFIGLLIALIAYSIGEDSHRNRDYYQTPDSYTTENA